MLQAKKQDHKRFGGKRHSTYQIMEKLIQHVVRKFMTSNFSQDLEFYYLDLCMNKKTSTEYQSLETFGNGQDR
jgi:hypothetical protein